MAVMAAVLASFFLQLGSHFIPWAQIAGKRKLHPVAAYTIGTLTIGLTFTVWALTQNAMPSIIEFWAIVIASGAGVAFGYGIDWFISIRAHARELKQENKLRSKQYEHLFDTLASEKDLTDATNEGTR